MTRPGGRPKSTSGKFFGKMSEEVEISNWSKARVMCVWSDMSLVEDREVVGIKK